MDSGDEEEDNQEEPEVGSIHIPELPHYEWYQPIFYFLFCQEKSKTTKGRRAAKMAKLGTLCVLTR